MKLFKFLSICVVLATTFTALTSCGDDKKDEPVAEITGSLEITQGSIVMQTNYVRAYLHSEERGYNILLTNDASVKIKDHMTNAPSCAWFMLNIPADKMGVNITDPKDLSSSTMWPHRFACSSFSTALFAPTDIKSISYIAKCDTEEKKISISLTFETNGLYDGKPVVKFNLAISGYYSPASGYITTWLLG